MPRFLARRPRSAFVLSGAPGGGACSSESDPPTPPRRGDRTRPTRTAAAPRAIGSPENARPSSGTAFSRARGATQEPGPGVFPYDVIAPLFADDAAQASLHPAARERRKGALQDRDPWELPVGSIVVKTFSFPPDASRSRRSASGSSRRAYSSARAPGSSPSPTFGTRLRPKRCARSPGGTCAWIGSTRPVLRERPTIAVPTTNDCKRCHGLDERATCSASARASSIAHRTLRRTRTRSTPLTRRGFFESPPPAGAREHLVDPQDPRRRPSTHAVARISTRIAAIATTRALPRIGAVSSSIGGTAPPASLGVCKSPSSAGDTGGRRFDVVPGKPEESVLLYRMQLTNSAYRMPEGSRAPDARGIEVVAGWITALPKHDCAGSASVSPAYELAPMY